MDELLSIVALPMTLIGTLKNCCVAGTDLDEYLLV